METTLLVRVGFASDPFDNPQTWTDITTDVLAINTDGGRQHELDRMEAGTVSILLKNTSNQYWPANASSPYYPNILPGKCVNIRGTYNAITYDLFFGYIEAWQPSWLRQGGVAPVVQLIAADALKNLARLELTDAVGYSAELSGTRIGNVLDDLAFPAGIRALDAGQSTMKASGALASENALAHLLYVQESERGILFVAGDGTITFHDRHARLKSPYTTSQATFGDDSGEQLYVDLVPSYDDEFLYNDVTVQRTGGVAQNKFDATSQLDYGKRSLSKLNLFLTTDAEATSQAEYLLTNYKTPAMRVKSITIYPQEDPTNLWAKVLGYSISTRITLRLNQASIDQDCHIEGIAHNYDSREGLWSTTWQLSNATSVVYWALGVAGFSELGTTTKLYY